MVVVNGFLLKHGVVVIRWLGLADLDVVVVNSVVVDLVAWACRSRPGFADLDLGLPISSFSLPAWWWLTACRSRLGGVGLGLEVVEPCRSGFFFFFLFNSLVLKL
jgi:hypothetical protein